MCLVYSGYSGPCTDAPVCLIKRTLALWLPVGGAPSVEALGEDALVPRRSRGRTLSLRNCILESPSVCLARFAVQKVRGAGVRGKKGGADTKQALAWPRVGRPTALGSEGPKRKGWQWPRAPLGLACSPVIGIVPRAAGLELLLARAVGPSVQPDLQAPHPRPPHLQVSGIFLPLFSQLSPKTLELAGPHSGL